MDTATFAQSLGTLWLQAMEEAAQLEKQHQHQRQALHNAMAHKSQAMVSDVEAYVRSLKSKWTTERSRLQQEAQVALQARDTAQQALADSQQQQCRLQAEVDALRSDVKDALAYRAAFKTEHAKHQRTKQKLAKLMEKRHAHGQPDDSAVQQLNTLLRDELHRCQQQCKALEQQLGTYRDAYGALLSSTAPCSSAPGHTPQQPRQASSQLPAPSPHNTPSAKQHVQGSPHPPGPPPHTHAGNPPALGARPDVIPATVVGLGSDSDDDQHTPGALGLVCMARPPTNSTAAACNEAATNTPTALQRPEGDAHPSEDSTPTGLQPPEKPSHDPNNNDPSCKRVLLPGPQSPPYKYQAVVRGRDARAQLTAVDCAECARFWVAMRSWGDGHQLPPCGHAPGTGTGTPLHALVQEVGRHRFKHVPPATPAGFWDIGFGDSPDNQQRKGSQP